MEQSILKSTKKILGVGPDDDSFDLDIITHINSAFSILNDLGIGPEGGFAIEDNVSEWGEFLDPVAEKIKLSKVRTIVFLRTKLAFDPPVSAYHMDSLVKQIQENEWRLSVNRETTDWVDPDPADLVVVDGGDPTGH